MTPNPSHSPNRNHAPDRDGAANRNGAQNRKRVPNRRRALVIALVATALIALIVAPAALAAAGGGSAGFSSGGGGGGGGGGGHNAFEIYIIFRVLFDIARLGHGLGLVFLVVVGALYWFFTRGRPQVEAWFRARQQSGRASRRDTRKRERKVELASAEAADEDPLFDPDHVRTSAAALFTAVEFAWDASDRIALRGLVAPDLLQEWERRLDDLDSKGWRNRVQLNGEPTVEYVGLARGSKPEDAKVTVRIEAKLHDYVVDRSGRHLRRTGQFSENVRLREFWTLQRRGDHWILASIEQGAEGSHALKEKIVQTPWADDGALRDEAMLEGAVSDSVPAGTNLADVADLNYTGGAKAAALDLSLADGRFAPDVLEIAARRAVSAWCTAVDGPDDELRKVADPSVIGDLLHPGDRSGKTRIVVRGAQVKQISVIALDAAADPATMTIDVDLNGRRYLEDRDTTRVIAGNQARAHDFTERWTFAVTGDATVPWKIVSVRTSALAA